MGDLVQSPVGFRATNYYLLKAILNVRLEPLKNCVRKAKLHEFVVSVTRKSWSIVSNTAERSNKTRMTSLLLSVASVDNNKVKRGHFPI